MHTDTPHQYLARVARAESVHELHVIAAEARRDYPGDADAEHVYDVCVRSAVQRLAALPVRRPRREAAMR